MHLHSVPWGFLHCCIMVCSTRGRPHLVTLSIILLLVVACVDVNVVGLTSHKQTGPLSPVPPSVSHSNRPWKAITRSSFEEMSSSQVPEDLDHANPWMVDSSLTAFMHRFNIPKVHGSGIKVDLGSEQDGHRQVSGLCPVFGKRIVLHQPSGYANDFLQDAPTTTPTTKPLQGGFNNPQRYQNGTPLSPVKDSWIQGKLGSSSPSTDIGRCARYAYGTVSLNPKTGVASVYKYPFVLDRTSKLCYVLAISAQELSGERHCSRAGEPPNLTWYCFEPTKDASSAERFVYGSALIGREQGDEWMMNCPVEAVRGAMFGTWEDGTCKPLDQGGSVRTATVQKKEECWKLVFENEGVASDQPQIPSTKQPQWQDFWPGYSATAPKSGGIGVNWANFYTSSAGTLVCSMFRSVPNCFAPSEGAVAYTALGRLAEADLPQCDSPLRRGECLDCQRIVYKCQRNSIIKVTEDCCVAGVPAPDHEDTAPPTNGRDEEANVPLGLTVAGGVVGGLVILGAAGAAGIYYFRPSSTATPLPIEQPGIGGKKGHRASDVIASTDMSVWGEAADIGGIIPPGEAVETNY